MRHLAFLVGVGLAIAGCAPAPSVAPAGHPAAVADRSVTLVGHLLPARELSGLVRGYLLTDVARLTVTASVGGSVVSSTSVNGAFTTSSTIALSGLAPNKTYTIQVKAYADTDGALQISNDASSQTTVSTMADGTGALSDTFSSSFNLAFVAKPVALIASLPISTGTTTYDSVKVDLQVGGSTVQTRTVVGPWYGNLTVSLTNLRANTSYTAVVSGIRSGFSDVVRNQAFSTPALDAAGTNVSQTITSVTL